MQMLQDPNQHNLDNLNYVRCKTSRYFRKKIIEYMEAEIDECNSKIINIRGLYVDIILLEGLQV
jgi:hypothetical protein